MASGVFCPPLDLAVAGTARRMTRRLRLPMPTKVKGPIKEKLTLVNEAEDCCFARARGKIVVTRKMPVFAVLAMALAGALPAAAPAAAHAANTAA